MVCITDSQISDVGDISASFLPICSSFGGKVRRARCSDLHPCEHCLGWTLPPSLRTSCWVPVAVQLKQTSLLLGLMCIPVCQLVLKLFSFSFGSTGLLKKTSVTDHFPNLDEKKRGFARM